MVWSVTLSTSSEVDERIILYAFVDVFQFPPVSTKEKRSESRGVRVRR